MDSMDQSFLEELKEAFNIEAQEHLQTIINGLIQLEQSPDQDSELLEDIYRAAHSLKGAARAVNYSMIGTICQSIEGVFSALKTGQIALNSHSHEVLQRSLDYIKRIMREGEEVDLPVSALTQELDLIAKSASPSLSKEREGKEALLENREEITRQRAPKRDVESPLKEKSSFLSKRRDETIRIATSKLDAIFLQMEDLITLKLAGEERISCLEEILFSLEEIKKGGERRGGPSWKLLSSIEDPLKQLLQRLQGDDRAAALLVDRLLENAKKLRMQPFSSLLSLFPKMVWDLAKEQKKEVELHIEGQEIEIDRRILEKLKDPLIHLLRNAIDHGLEDPLERLEKSKPEKGALTIQIEPLAGNKLQIFLADDGRGIDPEKVKKKALRLGIITEEEAQVADDSWALMLIFRSGFTIRDKVTSISGRGLGMAIVKEALEKMGGSIAMESYLGEGTYFRLVIPSTMATLRGVLILEGGQIFVIPISHVERALRLPREEVNSFEERESITINGSPLSLVRLGDILGLENENLAAKELFHALILQNGEERMVFLVDEIVKEQEILIKGLGPQLQMAPNIAGACVLGSGEVAPVLHVGDLMRSAISKGSLVVKSDVEKDKKAILLAEDTITSRMLLTQILKQEGFGVKAVVNGAEALEALKESSYDLVISDVQMPEMDGLTLIEKIRENRSHAHLPIILITSLESKEDRERGAMVGADAYIVKSSFDQGNLLEVVRRLLGEE